MSNSKKAKPALATVLLRDKTRQTVFFKPLLKLGRSSAADYSIIPQPTNNR